MNRNLPVWIALSVSPMAVVLLITYSSLDARSARVSLDLFVLGWTAAPGLVAAALFWGASHLSPPNGSKYLLIVAGLFSLLVAVNIGVAFWYRFVVPFDRVRTEPNIVWLTLPTRTLPVVVVALAPWVLLMLGRRAWKSRSDGA